MKAQAQPKSGRRPKLRQVVLEDYQQIAAFSAKYGFAGAGSRETWEHLWTDNPAFKATQGACPLGWVLENDRQIVGHIGNFPTLYELNGRQLVCASGRAWAVDPAHRGYSQLMLDEYLRQDLADLTLTNTANPLSYRAHLELGAAPVPVGRWEKRPIWITGYSQLLADWLSRRDVFAPTVLSYPLAALLSLKDTWHRAAVAKRAYREGEVAVSTGFDERFDTFWDDLRARYSNKLLAVRNRLTLEWHFKFPIREGRLWVVTVSREERMIAYAVFLLEDNASAVRRMLLADFQSLDRDDALFYAILRAGLDRSRRSGIHLLVTIGFSASGTDTSALAPYRRPLRSSPFVYKAKDHLSRLLADPEVWCPSLYDADASL